MAESHERQKARIAELEAQLDRHDATIEAGSRENAELRVQLAALRRASAEPVAWPDNRCPQCGTVHPLLAAQPAPAHCDECDPSFGCFDGGAACSKKPAPAVPEGMVMVPRELLAAAKQCIHEMRDENKLHGHITDASAKWAIRIEPRIDEVLAVAQPAPAVPADMVNALRYLFDSTAEDGQWEESGVHNFIATMLAAAQKERGK